MHLRSDDGYAYCDSCACSVDYWSGSRVDGVAVCVVCGRRTDAPDPVAFGGSRAWSEFGASVGPETYRALGRALALIPGSVDVSYRNDTDPSLGGFESPEIWLAHVVDPLSECYDGPDDGTGPVYYALTVCDAEPHDPDGGFAYVAGEDIARVIGVGWRYDTAEDLALAVARVRSEYASAVRALMHSRA